MRKDEEAFRGRTLESGRQENKGCREDRAKREREREEEEEERERIRRLIVRIPGTREHRFLPKYLYSNARQYL